MDIFNLNEKVKGLVSYLQDTGYSAMYIDYVKKMAEWLSGNSEHYKWKSLADVEPTLKELWSNKYTCRNKVRLLRVILPIYREWIITRRMQTLHQTSPLRIAWRRIQECNGHGFQRGRQALQIFNKREVCAIFVLLPVTGNGCVFIRINNRGCGVGSVFQRRKTEDGPFAQIFGGVWAESLFALLWQIR